MAKAKSKSEHPVRLVVIDLDGTFLRDDKSIPEENLRALALLNDCKIPYSVATGRSYISAFPFLEHFSNQVPVILQNGALMLWTDSLKKHRQISLSSHVARFVFSKADAYGLHCVVSRGWLEDACLWLNKPYEGIYLPYLEKHGIQFSLSCPEKTFTKDDISEVVLLGCESKMHRLISETFHHFSNTFSIIKSFEWQGETFLEIMGPNVSKSLSIKHLCDHLSIPVESVLFIGDNYNDLDAMTMVGYPVAVSNALEPVKDRACFVSKSNNEGGVGHAINYMLQKWSFKGLER